MEFVDVVIVGGGLAGLCCARRLSEAGVSFLLLEASDEVGGRVRTDRAEGFLLDRGFQVLLTAYPEARRMLNYETLDLRAFEPGALVRLEHGFSRITDPWRQPHRALRSLFSGIGTLPDKLSVAWLRSQVCRGLPDDAFDGPELSTADYLRERGFSSEIVERFFRPLFGGIFLERELQTPSSMFRFVFRMLASGDVAIPALGMQQIPNQLASSLPPGSVLTGARVESISAGRVTLRGGKRIEARKIVIATEGPEAARLLQERPAGSRSVTCLYFAASTAPVTEAVLVLDGEDYGPVNNLCVPSLLSPGLAPPGAVLISASLLDYNQTRPEQLEADTREQLARWFGREVWSWRLLRMYRIHHAQPDPSVSLPRRDPRIARDLYVCGDYCIHASIEGAIAAGRRAGKAVVEDLTGQLPDGESIRGLCDHETARQPLRSRL